MTDKELFNTLKRIIRKEEHFSTDVLDVLRTYKNSGGKRKTAENFVHILEVAYEDNEVLNKRTQKIRDAISVWHKKIK